MRRAVLAAAVAVVLWVPAGAQELKDIEAAYLKVVRKVRASVVAITVLRATTIHEEGITISSSTSTQFSGISVTGEGHIVTVARAVKDAAKITVEALGGERREAEIIGVDEGANIGVIKVKDARDWSAAPAEFGDSGSLEVGSLAVAAGCPGGLKHSVVYGNVSGFGRTLVSPSGYYTDMIQLSCPASQCDPGGLVANSEGKLVGMVSPAYIKTPSFRRLEDIIESLNRKVADLSKQLAKRQKEQQEEGRGQEGAGQERDRQAAPRVHLLSPPDLHGVSMGQDIGFAIPGNVVKQVCERIIEGKKQPWVGVSVRDLSPAEKEQFKIAVGIYVLDVVAGGPAAAGGIQPDDVITAVAGQSIENMENFQNLVRDRKIGDELTFSVFRKKENLRFQVKLGERK